MFPSLAYLREVVLMRERVRDFSVYPFSLPLLQGFESLELDPKVTIFVGENGSGKSTLLEGMAVALGMNAEGGGRNNRFETRGTHSELHDCLKFIRGTRRPRDTFFLRAEGHYTFSTYLEDIVGGADSYGGKPLHEMSHGESFWAVLRHRFGEDGLYLLDEPESALSPTRQLAALAQMNTLAACGSQFILATHSPILMAFPGATIYRFGEGLPERVAYEETEHYRVFRDFFDRREVMLKELLAEEE
jgi:predicted ATPase